MTVTGAEEDTADVVEEKAREKAGEKVAEKVAAEAAPAFRWKDKGGATLMSKINQGEFAGGHGGRNGSADISRCKH